MFQSDKPIENSQGDLLSRKEFAEQLAKAIVNYEPEDNFNIGLYGSWGSGKTSIINMVEEFIGKAVEVKGLKNKPIIFRFNPWLLSNQEQITKQFFKQLANRFSGQKDKKVQVVAKGVDFFGSLLSKAPFPGAGLIGEIVRHVAGATMDGTQDIQAAKNDLIAELKGLKRKIVVIIDDVDRLTKEEVRTLFRLIKSVADFPNTIYLLSFDYEVVSAALDGEQSDSSGEKYLEKFIQVPFEVPLLDKEKLENLCIQKMEEIFEGATSGNEGKEVKDLYRSHISFFINNIRDMNRYTNLLALKYSYLKNEVNIHDLAGITVIQMFAPQIYSALPEYMNEYYGLKATILNKLYKEKLENLLKNREDDGVRERIKRILEILFPERRYDHYAEIQNVRVCSSHFFGRYFSLDLNKSISVERLEEAINSFSEENLVAFLAGMDSKRNIVLEYIESTFRLGKLSTDRVKVLFLATVRYLDGMPITFNGWISIITQTFLLKWPEEIETIKEIFGNAKISLSVQVRVLNELEGSGRTEDIVMLKEIYDEKRGDLLENQGILDEKEFDLIESREYKKSEAAYDDFREKIYDMIKNDTQLGKFVSCIIRFPENQQHQMMEEAFFGGYIKSLDAFERMEKFVKEEKFFSLSELQQDNIISFLINYEKQQKDSCPSEATRQEIDEYRKRESI